ncbi:MAG: type I DNA topoisomerase [Rickettsiales bacterium]|jgi:DNA topoisomerase-1|nr:type I DNA topoisomerase [Rickettsiales bacterium]
MKLMIVESPAKAKTIEKYLGKDWRVVASVGHVRDLVPENGSIDVENDFAPNWQIMPGKEKVIKQITDLVEKADEVYLASDPDREGEAIAWHILEILIQKGMLADKKVFRVAFHEITKNAILSELKNPRGIDQNLVDAYLVRRALDYLIGFSLSPVLWRKSIGKSAGRVQSVAVWLVVEREKEIEKFKAEEYWSIDAECAKSGIPNAGFMARLSKFDGKKIEKMSIGNKKTSDEILAALNAPFSARVANVEKKQTQRRPYAPFTTSTLQQEAARKLHFSSKRTMAAAQHLYEQGFITYMRTDSTNLSADAINDIRTLISKDWGDSYIPSSPNVYAKKQKNAQEAHEAIRPTRFDVAADVDEADGKKLYDLIWKRALASQMSNAVFDSVAVDLEKNEAAFHATGQTMVFDGFLKVYNETKDDEDEEKDARLPELAVGDSIDVSKLVPEQHFTMPPPRFTEASLVKKLEELGIGRPSTYASIMSTIVDRNYAELDKSRRFIPTMGGWLVSAFLADYFNQLIQVDFTAKTENALDDIADGQAEKLKILGGFWAPFAKWVESAKDVPIKDIWDKLNSDLATHIFKDGENKCPECGGGLALRQGKFGAFLSCKNYPECKYIKNVKSAETKDEKPDIDLGDGLVFKVGRFGPYVSDGTKNASAKKYSAETITRQIARDLLDGVGKKAEPVLIGKNPKTDSDIFFYPTGRYGPYISSNKVNVGVKEQPDLETAADLINNKKTAPFRKKWNR